ncbi:hypothetical protein Tco_0071782 [Tanacetum coccineum]
MFQPWRALATIINLCLTGKTSGFERPRAPVLQIQLEDKRNLAQQAQGKKKATIILIPSIRFTKLIIFHLQRLHNFHPRPESPLHLPTKEPVLGNLKFSAKGTKREVFGMTIPNELINDVIRGADYYEAYLNKVAKHQRFLAGEEVSDPDSPAPKPAKPARQTKPKPTKQSKPTEPKAASKKPKPAPAKPQKKKRKPASESSEAPPLAKRAKAGKVVKKRTVKSSKQLVDEFVDEGVPTAKPSLEDTEEAILQKVLQESLTDAYPTQRGPLPPVVFRETDTGKFQPLPEVPGKGKEKVGEEQAAQVLLNLQTPKKKSPAEQYIFQRRSHIPSETAGREDSTSLYAELGLSGSDTESDEEMPSVVRSGAQDEGQAGPDPGTLDEGQAGPNPDDVAESQPLPTPSVLAGPNLEHSDVEIIDPSSQPQPEHIDEGFTAAAYPDVQENLKLTVDEQVIPEEPVSSTGTLSSIQHLAKDFSFGDKFLNDKPSEADNEKTTADTEAESMVSVTIQQDISVFPPMTSPVIGPVPRQDSPNVHGPLPTTTTTTVATTTTTLPLPPQPQQGPSDPILIKRMGELEEFIANLVEENQALETRLDKQGSRINKLETMDLPKMIREQTDSIRRDESEDFDVDKAQEETKKKSKQDSPNTPPGSPPSPPPPPPPLSGASGASGTTGASDSVQAPPPPPPSSSTHQGGQSTSTAAPSSSKTTASAEFSAWTTTDTRIKPSITTIPDDLYMDDETTADEHAYSSGDEVGRDHIPTVNLRQSWWKPLTEDRPATPEPAWTIPSSDLTMPTNNWASTLKSTYAPLSENSLHAQTGDMAIFMDWYCKRQGITHLILRDLEGPTFEIVKVFHPSLTISNSKWKSATNFSPIKWMIQSSGLKRNASDDHRSYVMDLLHGWFSKENNSTCDRFHLKETVRAVRTHFRLLRKGLQIHVPKFLKRSVLVKSSRSLEPPITQRQKDSNYRCQSMDQKLGYQQRVEDFQLGIESYQMQLNRTKPRLEATGFTLDYRVKEFRINRTNPGMNARFWTKKDVDRSKDFMFAIQKRLKTRRIFRNWRALLVDGSRALPYTAEELNEGVIL